MEYHWYEDYWAMPRNLPRGHEFFIGYYQTQRAIHHHVIEFLAVFHGSRRNSLIGIDPNQHPVWMLCNTLGVVLLLNFKTLRLHFRHGTDTAIWSYHQLNIFGVLRLHVLASWHPFYCLPLLESVTNSLLSILIFCFASQMQDLLLCDI